MGPAAAAAGPVLSVKQGRKQTMSKNKQKNSIRIAAVLLSAAVLGLSGCAAAKENAAESTTAAAEESSVSTEAVTEESSEDTTTAADVEQETDEAPVLKRVRITAHETDRDQNYIVNYDETGRVISLGCYYDTEEAPTDPDKDYTIYVEYNETADGVEVDAHYREEFLDTYAEDDPMYPTVEEVTATDGKLSLLRAGYDALLRVAFDENGLPTHCMESQESGDYAITYTQNEDGTYSFESAEFEVPGYFDDDTEDKTVENTATVDGEVTYWE